MSSIKEKTISGFIWRMAQNIGTQLISFVVSVVLARILTPDDYGVVALVTVFTSIALVFINTGFCTAIIQKKEVTKSDLSTMFYSGLFISIVLYIFLYFISPLIANFYNTPILSSLLRVESAILLIGALYSIHQAIIIRNMEFRKSFIVGLSGIAIQGIVGITLALLDYGPWALVYSTLANYIVCSIVMWMVVSWRPSFIFSKASFRKMSTFSINILLNELLNTVFNNVRAIIIGKQYTKADLAYFNRGSQIPSLVMTQIDGAMTTVLFSSLSKYQNDWSTGLSILRKTIKTSFFICAPLMLCLCAMAEPIIRILLTDKWIESVPYLRLGAIICLFWPLSAHRHALNALGKSGLSLFLSTIQKILILFFLILTYNISIEVMIGSSIFVSFIMLFINGFYYKKYLNYKYLDQLQDIFPTFVLASMVGMLTYVITYLNLNVYLTLFLQILISAFLYVLGARVFCFTILIYIKRLVSEVLEKNKS